LLFMARDSSISEYTLLPAILSLFWLNKLPVIASREIVRNALKILCEQQHKTAPNLENHQNSLFFPCKTGKSGRDRIAQNCKHSQPLP